MSKYRILFIISVSLVVGIVIYYYATKRPRVHHYWDQQPVSRNFGQIGKISKTRLKSIDLPNLQTVSFNIVNTKTEKTIENFIDHNFLKGYRYTLPFLRWSMPNDPSYNLALVSQIPNGGNQKDFGQLNRLVGTISGKPVTIVINNKSLKMGYVDYLAVHKSYRGKRLATALISKLVETYPSDVFLFKIEDTPLPFDSICKFRYYVYPVKSHNPNLEVTEPILKWTPLSHNKLAQAYQYYQLKSRQFRYYQTYTRDQFRDWFLPENDVVHSYIMLDNGRVIGFTSYFCLTVKSGFLTLNRQESSIAELLVILSDNLTSHLKLLLEQLKLTEIDYLVATNLGKNKIFIDRLPFIPGKRCYLQMYNYGTMTSYDPSEVLINIP